MTLTGNWCQQDIRKAKKIIHIYRIQKYLNNLTTLKDSLQAVAHLVEWLSIIHEALGSIWSICKPYMYNLHNCNFCTKDVEAGGSKVHGHPQSQNEFEVILDNMRLYLRNELINNINK